MMMSISYSISTRNVILADFAKDRGLTNSQVSQISSIILLTSLSNTMLYVSHGDIEKNIRLNILEIYMEYTRANTCL